VFGDDGEEGTVALKLKILADCDAGNTQTPVLAAKPIAELAYSIPLEAHHVTSDSAIDEDGLFPDRLVGEQPGPTRHVRGFISRRDLGHLNGEWIGLVAKENGDVVLHDFAQCDGVHLSIIRSQRASPCQVSSSTATGETEFDGLFGRLPENGEGSWQRVLLLGVPAG
jgi:hypothetical protein